MIENPILRNEWTHHLSAKQLSDFGFKRYIEYEGFTYFFPVYVRNNVELLRCKITAFVDPLYTDSNSIGNKLSIDVYTKRYDLYAPFYVYNKGYEGFISGINKKILQKLYQFGLYEE